MQDLKDDYLIKDVELAKRIALATKWLKLILAAIISLAYLFGADWLFEVIVFAVIVSLVLPLGFFDVFIQKLLEYNTQKIEERELLNAKEANEHLHNLHQREQKMDD